MRFFPRLLLGLLPIAETARVGLHKAADEGQVEPLRVAIRGKFNEYEDVWVRPDLNKRNKKGHVPLHLAICGRARQDLTTVTALLDAGADAGARDGADETPLHVVARRCAGEQARGDISITRASGIAKLLIGRDGVDINARGLGARGLTPLHVAAERGHPALVELLIKAGADLNAADGAGATPLHLAARAGQAKVVLSLLRAGADPSRIDADGRTARDAVAGGRDSFSSAVRGHLDNAASFRAEGEGGTLRAEL
mmetsp:Transcript_40033/g.129604  ORF Transcript_40033/g.129604 Transcript_40033/m.129604 type:complete len:254 (-) Transcript_40033:140-901(-)